MYNGGENSETFDQDHLEEINGLIQNHDNSISPKVDCSSLNAKRRGVKQGCVLSPTLFSIYVNDLANDINDMLCGVDINGSNVAILLYADDIVLLSDSEASLLTMLNKLNDWCNKWRMTVNQAKTKIIHFRSQNKARSDYDFRCGEYTTEYESSYKYLGFWINEYLDLSKSIREVTKSASRALGAVYTKYLCAGGMGYDVYTKLVNSVVEPVLFYCAGIWGICYKEIDVVLNKACKYFLGTRMFLMSLPEAIWVGYLAMLNRNWKQ